MLVEGRSWDLFQVPGEQSICPFVLASQYFIKGDTLLDGLIYKKVYSYAIRSSPPFPFCGGFYVDTTTSFLGSNFYREDTLARKIYQWTSDETPHEKLLYDFSLQAGDTLHYQFQSYPILSVTDRVLENGAHRKAFEIGGWFNNYYVEEIGYLMGQFGQVYYPLEGWIETTCVRDGDGVLYSDALTGGPGCVLATSSTQNPDIQAFKISPNPFSEHLILQIPAWQQGVSFVFELYDLAGRTVFYKKIEHTSDVHTVDLPPLPQGVYGWAVDGILQGKLVRM